MKPLTLLDPASAQILGFDWLTSAVAPVSPYGERCFAELRPFFAGEEAAAEARADSISALAAALEVDRLEAARVTLRDLPDAAGAIARASMGDVLADPSFLELRRFCEGVDRVDGLVADHVSRPRLADDPVRAIFEALAPGRGEDGGFYLADAFDAGLEAAREALVREQAELDAARGREKERAARELGRDEIAGDEFIVMRADLHGTITGRRARACARRRRICSARSSTAKPRWPRSHAETPLPKRRPKRRNACALRSRRSCASMRTVSTQRRPRSASSTFCSRQRGSLSATVACRPRSARSRSLGSSRRDFSRLRASSPRPAVVSSRSISRCTTQPC